MQEHVWTRTGSACSALAHQLHPELGWEAHRAHLSASLAHWPANEQRRTLLRADPEPAASYTDWTDVQNEALMSWEETSQMC